MDFQSYLPQEWKPVATTSHSEGSFDCNICFEFAQEPVVTFCGHLYCWPCIFQWLNVQTTHLASIDPPKCPVCKSSISHSAMIPLYGRGRSSSNPHHEHKTAREITIPPRPSARGLNPDNQPPRHPTTHRNHHYNLNSLQRFEDSTLVNFPPPAVTEMQPPVVGMVGEMMYASVFGNSHGVYSYPSSYHVVTNRWRREEMEADKSLSRISIFLFCCILLCLIVF